MLTTEAFNALLKTLEEPPAHVIFIFATTDPQSFPPPSFHGCSATISKDSAKKRWLLA